MMVKKYKCSVCGKEVVDIIKDENGVYFCWNCLDNVDESDFVDFNIELGKLMFKASSIQKMGNRWIIEIPKKSSAEMKIERMDEAMRRHHWKIFAKSVYGG